MNTALRRVHAFFFNDLQHFSTCRCNIIRIFSISLKYLSIQSIIYVYIIWTVQSSQVEYSIVLPWCRCMAWLQDQAALQCAVCSVQCSAGAEFWLELVEVSTTTYCIVVPGPGVVSACWLASIKSPVHPIPPVQEQCSTVQHRYSSLSSSSSNIVSLVQYMSKGTKNEKDGRGRSRDG